MATTKKAPKLATTVAISTAEAEELMTDEELDARAEANTKKTGRPRNENWLPWEEAREFIHSQHIASRSQYEKWWEREKPKTISRFPYRVYKEEWTSWNDFLGNDNKFNERINIKWRPLLDCISFVHELKLKSHTEWLEYYRLNKDQDFFPKDIPARPDLVYDDWRSWGHFLGNRPVEAVQARQEARQVQIYSIVHYKGDPLNVLVYGVDPNATTFKERFEDQEFNIVKTYWFNPQYSDQINNVLDAFSSQYLDNRRQRITPNVFDVLWHLDQFLDPVRRGEV